MVVVTDHAARSDQYVSSDLISFARDDRRRPPIEVVIPTSEIALRHQHRVSLDANFVAKDEGRPFYLLQLSQPAREPAGGAGVSLTKDKNRTILSYNFDDALGAPGAGLPGSSGSTNLD